MNPSAVKYQLRQPDIHVVLPSRRWRCSLALEVFVVAALHVGPNVEIAQVLPEQCGDAAHCIVELPLDVDEQRVVARSVGVRSVP